MCHGGFPIDVSTVSDFLGITATDALWLYYIPPNLLGSLGFQGFLLWFTCYTPAPPTPATQPTTQPWVPLIPPYLMCQEPDGKFLVVGDGFLPATFGF